MSEEKQFNEHYLFVRTDEKYEEVRAEVHNLELDQKEMKNNLDRIEKRVDFGVALTGQKNSDEIGRQAVEIGKIKQTQEIEQLKLVALETTLGDKLDKIGKSVDLLYKGIVTIFFTTVIGGIVIYGFRFFHS